MGLVQVVQSWYFTSDYCQAAVLLETCSVRNTDITSNKKAASEPLIFEMSREVFDILCPITL